jgi:hypothetical protein
MDKTQLTRVSVLSIAIHADEFEPLLRELEKQTFQNFEFIGEIGGTIPEAWNRAVQRARGEIIVFTETDARPVNQFWLEDLVSSVKDPMSIVKGLEVTSTPLDLSNLAAYRQAFVSNYFDETFRWAEDTELFSRMKEQGYQIIQLDKAPVIHLSKYKSKQYIRRSFLYGLYWARLRHRYANPVELANVKYALKQLFAALLNLAGMAIGTIIFLPERRKRGRPG